MNYLFQKIKKEVLDWRNNGYKSNFPEIKSILLFNLEEKNRFKYLRKAQFEAIETYLFLRFIRKSPKVIDLYKKYYSDLEEFCKVLEISHINKESFEFIDSHDKIITSVRKNNGKYNSLLETIELDYPSYILALAMGSGKTHIISAIIAIEFAIGMYNEEKECNVKLMQNALVFAPGTTILKNSLKKIASLPFEKILPPEICKIFLANVKFIYASEKSNNLQIDRGSKYNIIISNSEKLILKASNKRDLLNYKKEERELISNNRLDKIKSLPNLGIFSDEAHHTYGSVGSELKRVRETINHLHKNKELVCVINTTGTPYSEKKIIKDVIFWYGLEEGIKDGILKSLENGIIEYSFSQKGEEEIIKEIIIHFFTKYTSGFEKIAFYFKTEEQLEKTKRFIELALFNIGKTSDIILKNTQTSSSKEIEEFHALDEPTSKKQVILLIGKGKEGWDCKTLFATALISEASSSNNYILQASTRCLRQIDGNSHAATIYLSYKNAEILNKELEASFGITTKTLNNQKPSEEVLQEIKLQKLNIPKLQIIMQTREIAEEENIGTKIILSLPQVEKSIKSIKNLEGGILKETLIKAEIIEQSNISLLLLANHLANKFHLKSLEIFKELAKIYEMEAPKSHIQFLEEQISRQKQNYKEITKYVKKVLAIVKYGEEGFKKSPDGNYYFHTLKFESRSKKLDLLKSGEQKYSFHYSPLNFDSNPEMDFHAKLLQMLGEQKENIEDIYFTGGLSENFTDFHFEYEGVGGKYHKYFPDFLIKKKTGELLIVEIKAESEREAITVKAKEKAMQEVTGINANKIKYIIIYSNGEEINRHDKNYLEVKEFINS